MSETKDAASDAVIAPVRPANNYVLSGGGLHVGYASSSISGQPTLSYQDTTQSRSFSGSQLSSVEVPSVGTMVTVTLSIVPDHGTNLFSLLVPAVTLEGIGVSAHVVTHGIATVHRTSLLGVVAGQVETYHVTRLTGTADSVIF